MIKKVVIGFLIFVLIGSITACNQTESLPVVESELSPSWQNSYAAFLREPSNYAEDEHFAETFALVDLDNSGIPELIIVYYNGIEGGSIFANLYLYDENINIIGQRIDMYYKQAWLSTNPLFPGLFVEGGRSSAFSCNYWTVINNAFIDEPLWSFAYNPDFEEMEYKDLLGNEQLIAESKKFSSNLPDSSTVNLNDIVKFFQIDEANIMEAICGGA